MAVLWLLLRARWRQAWRPSLAVCLLIGGVGGFVLASIAAARAVDGAYRSLLVEIDAPDFVVIPECQAPVNGIGCESPTDETEGVSDDTVIESLLATGIVEQARTVEFIFPYFVDADGAPLLGTPENESGCGDFDGGTVIIATKVGGGAQSLPIRLDGDLPTAGTGGVVLSHATAQGIDIGIGEHVRLAGWCTGDGEASELDVPLELSVLGLSVGALDVEPPAASLEFEPAYVDPVAFEALIAIGAERHTESLVWLKSDVSSAEESEGLASFYITLDFRERARLIDEALATDARLLRLLAAIGAVGGILVVAPVIGRHLRDTGPEPAALAAIGARPPLIAQQAVGHALALAGIGAVSSAIVAVPLAAVMPRGLAAAISPRRVLRFDGLVTGVGVGALVTVVGVIGVLTAWRLAGFGGADTKSLQAGRAGVPSWIRLRPAARTGVLAAVGAPAGPRRSSPWPSLVSMMVVATAGVAGVTYLAGLHHLEETPRVVGWNWDTLVSFEFGQGDPSRVSELTERLMEIDGVEQVTAGTGYPPAFVAVPDTDVSFVWPWAFATGPHAITPTMVSGRAPSGPREVAIDAVLADQIGLTVGDIASFERRPLVAQLGENLRQSAEESGAEGLVLSEYDDQPVIAMFEITGIAVLPLQRSQEIPQAAFTLEGFADFVEPTAEELADARAWLPKDIPPELDADVQGAIAAVTAIDEQPENLYLRFSDDAPSTYAAVESVEGVGQIVAPTPEQVLSLIVSLNVERSDRVPIALAGTVAALTIVLAGYLLATSVSARRFELALMRSLGMSTGGIRRSVAAQATATASIVLMVAIPAGILIGRWAWLGYARDLSVLPVSVIPWPTLAIVIVAAFATANIAAITLGWRAITRSPGRDLRSE